MSFASFFGLGKAKATPPAAVAGMRARPLVVQDGNPSAAEKIAHAKWRLDAIRRTIEQSGSSLSKQHLAEFRDEVRDHCNTLVKAGHMTDDQAHALIKSGGRI